MKKSSVIAVVAALAAVLLIFAACGKNNKGDNGITNPTVIGDDGQVYEEITEIASEIVTETVPVTDASGETETVTVVRTVPVTKAGGVKVTNKSGEQETVTEVVTEVKTEVVSEVVTEVVTYTQPVTTTEKSKDKDKDNAASTEATTTKDDLPYPAGAQVEVETDANGRPKNSMTDKLLASLRSSEQLSIKFTAISPEAFGAGSGMPIEWNIKGDKMSMTFTMGALKGKMIMNGSTFSMVFPAARAYYTVSDGTEDMAQDFQEMNLAKLLTDENLDYKETTTVKVDGKDYTCEVYGGGAEGTEVKFYFSGNALKRIEYVDSGASEAQILKVTSISTSVSDSEFEIPKGYTKLSEDKFNSMIEGFGTGL